MDITKYSHACFVVEKAESAIVVDPGSWTGDLVVPAHVVGVVVTHEHADHCDVSLLNDIVTTNPAVIIYGHSDVVSRLHDLPTRAVAAGETVRVGDFALTFVGGKHAVIDESMPAPANLGVLVDDGALYYPGDSFVLPEHDIKTLAVPAAAPWMKFSEAAAFIRAIKPRTVFPTHDAILSSEGKLLADRMLGAVCQEVGATYERL